ncbi:major tail protein [Mycobacterium phage Panchino]|uniref:Major tail protein n=2 Tax=Charlievirus TaxID=1623280 RepID=A0A142ULH9_9CAUD|nr:major tail protein [Mycobacterium phage Panchino]YP_009595704.1 major tail protein [Mycobacterium phage SkinnyPete]AMS02031.1 major tail protein [Mycobacterium phage Panchino]AMU78443.1 major tail protein [Mycobacterium phage SkinnyPete]
MAQPNTGVSFKASGLGIFDTLRIRRGGKWNLLVRDYKGSATNISPSGDFGAPMALDGNWRNDLLAVKKNARGQWVYNNQPNLGFHLLGAANPDGFAQEHDINVDELEILQSIDPARVDLTSRAKRIVFTGYENKPLLHRLINDLPLDNILDLGSGTYFSGESAEIDFVERQMILIHEDKAGGKPERVAFPVPRCVRTGIGNLTGTKTDPLSAQLTFARILDPWFVDGDGAPLIGGVWVSGEGWDESVVPGLTFVPPAPVATPTGATAATITFAEVLGGVSPYTYTVEKSANADMSSSSAATVGSTDVTDGVVTLTLSGLTASSTSYFRVKVTDADGDVALSMVTNAATQPAS